MSFRRTNLEEDELIPWGMGVGTHCRRHLQWPVLYEEMAAVGEPADGGSSKFSKST